MQTKKSSQVTISDIARYAGVSKSSVSCVLNGRSKVGAQTRERILATIQKYNFEPKSSARALSTNKTYQMGFIISSKATLGIANSYFGEMLNSAQQTFQSFGYHTLVATYDQTKMSEFLVPKKMQQNCFDGVLVAGQTSPLALSKLQNSGIPFIVIGGEEYPDNVLALRNNMLDTYVNLIELLAELGDRRICVGGYYNQLHNLFMKSVNKFKDNHSEYLEVLHVLFEGINEFDDGKTAAQEWLKSPADKRYDAFIASDQACCGFLAVLTENNIKCPEEINVVATGNSQLSKWNSIPLTSVDTEMDKQGEIAATALIDIVENRKKLEEVKGILDQTYSSCTIIERKSTRSVELQKS